MTIVTIYDNKTTFLIKHYSEVSRREVINEIYIWGVKAETRKSKGRENIAPKTSVLKACLLSLCLSDAGICLGTPLCCARLS